MTTLDTSGVVTLIQAPFDECPRPLRHDIRWEDLSPFAQGYVEALFADLRKRWGTGDWAFRYLAPEAIAMILRDCGAMEPLLQQIMMNATPGVEAGRAFFDQRQDGHQPKFPPLRVYLNDAGKVMLEEIR